MESSAGGPGSPRALASVAPDLAGLAVAVRVGLLASLLASLVGAGCSVGPRRPSRTSELQALEKGPWQDPNHVIAEVNGRTITRGDFYGRILRRFGTAKLLAGILKEELFLQEANRRNIQVSPSEVALKVDEILDQMAREAGGRDELARIYEREGLSLLELRRDMEREVAGQLLIGKVTIALRRVDQDLLEKYYRETYGRTRYKARHIAYSFAALPGQSEGDVNRRKLEAFNKARRAADRVRQGADFAALARAESQDQVTASRGGDLGYVHADSPMAPALKQAVLDLPVGGVSEPVENPQGGYHIFQVTEIVPSQSYVDCEDRMRQELLEREPDLEEIEQALRILRDRSDIRLFGFSEVDSPGAEVPPGVPGGMPREVPAGSPAGMPAGTPAEVPPGTPRGAPEWSEADAAPPVLPR